MEVINEILPSDPQRFAIPRLTAAVLVCTLLTPLVLEAEVPAETGEPSAHTSARAEALRAVLPFADTRDFDEHHRGFIAAPAERVIRGDDGREVWNIGAYDFLLDGEPIDAIHPSLQRQATLNMNYGLYEVVPERIYQVRGFDLSNLTLVRGERGWILFDVLLTRETARAALEFANAQLGARPVIAVVYSHSHVDHFGGVRGVVDEARVKAGEVAIIAPAGFMDHAVSENVYAGNAMNRRAAYQYGRILPVGPFGQVDSAIGKATARGQVGLIAPTDEISADFEERIIDGVRMIFQNTPGTEAPAEMNTYFPQWKAFWVAENVTATIHNVYTLRGALVRDALQWSKHINEALYRFGGEAEVMLASHNWPRWGNGRIREVLRAQRDAYANLNNQVLHLANQGVTINEIHNVYRVPASLAGQWSVRQYHGSEFHNARAVLNRYLGYWDGNPATLMPLSPADSAPLYVEMMGGAEPILARSRALYGEGEYRLAMELVNKLVYAQPGNREAARLLADIFEQLGYQAESTSVRNVHLAAAAELRHGVVPVATSSTVGSDLARSLSTAQWWDAVAIRVDSAKADGMAFVINFVTPDNGERFIVEMSGGTLTSIQGYQAEDADVEIRIDRAALEPAIAGETTLGALLQQGHGTVRGDARVLAQLASTLVQFDPAFEIMPGTGSR